MVTVRRPLDLLTYASCVLGVAPLYPFLEPAAQLAAPAALAIGIICDRRDRYLLGRHVATLLSLLLFTYYALRINRADLVEPVVNVLVLLLAIRLVTAKSGRNYLQIFLLAIFALAGSSLLSLNLFFLPALLLLVLCLTIGLVLLCFYGSDPGLALSGRDLRRVLVSALLLPLGSLLLMLVFFVILPRTERPLWNFLNPGGAAVGGFSETVRPGAYASNAALQALVFRVQTEKIPLEDLYWRGTVLNTLAGDDWLRREPPAGERVQLRGGRRVRQTIYLEPQNNRFLFALDPPGDLAGIRVRSSADLVSMVPRVLNRRVSYQAQSPVGAILEPTTAVDRTFYLRTPAGISTRLRATATRLAAGTDAAGEKVARTEAFFRAQKLSYATSDLPGPTAPIDDFLFGKKRGYCEFFASSFALLLRLEGVPTRLVGGYHGGTWNEIGGYYTVTEDMAHVWVEVLIDGSWQRRDPSSLAQNAPIVAAALAGRTVPWSRSLLDAAEYYWTQAVITYDLGRQLELVRGAGRRLGGLRPGNLPSPRQLLLPGFLLVLAGGGGWLLLRLRIPAEQRLARRFLRLAARRRDLERIPAAEGLEHLAERLGDPHSREFARIFGGAVFRDRRLSGAEKQRLRFLLKELRKKPEGE